MPEDFPEHHILYGAFTCRNRPLPCFDGMLSAQRRRPIRLALRTADRPLAGIDFDADEFCASWDVSNARCSFWIGCKVLSYAGGFRWA